MREISAGVIIYRKSIEGPKFLILYHGHGYWNFAKGKIENEERSWEAAVREVREETGLKLAELKFKKRFKAYERFVFRRKGENVFKTVIFYLAETRQPKIEISKEHQGYGWFLYKDSKKILGKFKDSQRVFDQAYDFLVQEKKSRQPIDELPSEKVSEGKVAPISE